MKNKFLKLFDYLRQLITNEYPDRKSAVKKRKVVTEDNLRWQDDGGPVVDITKPIPQAAKDNPINRRMCLEKSSRRAYAHDNFQSY